MQIVQIVELDKKRVRVFLENGKSFPLYKNEEQKFCLKEGENLSKEQYHEIYSEILIKRARKRVLHLLEKMDRTESQLRIKLQQGFYPEDIIEDAIEYVKEYHYLDDIRYAKNFVRNQKDKKSLRQIQIALCGKGINRELIQQALEEEYQQENEQELIRKWMEKKHYSSKAADLKEKRKMYQFLVRKGFQSDDILHVQDNRIK